MKEWCRQNRANPKVWTWLAANPPHPDFEGTSLEWAYLNIPLEIL